VRKEPKKSISERVKWCIKQLLPLTYRSKYGEAGKRYFSVWNIWFGKVFNYDKYQIIE
jgi:hypothetical protein